MKTKKSLAFLGVALWLGAMGGSFALRNAREQSIGVGGGVVSVPDKRKISMTSKYRAAGSGTNGVDGDYPAGGTLNGATQYILDSNHWLAWSVSLNRWAFGSSLGFTGPTGTQAANQYYYSSAGNITTVPLTGWTTLAGSNPAPTVTAQPAAVYNGTGAGSAGFTGAYVEGAINNGKATYYFDTTVDKYAWWDGFQWKLGLAVNGLQGQTYYLNDSTSATLPLTGWYDGATSQGTDPGPTFTLAVATPTISGISPTSGHWPNTVTITGTNLTGATAISFNGTNPPSTAVNAPTYTVNSATQITVQVPAGATSGTISVTTPGGTATSGTFTVTPAAGTYRAYLAPSLGSVGLPVITGAGFLGSVEQEGGTVATNIVTTTVQEGFRSEPIYNVITETGPGPTIDDNGGESSSAGAMICVHALKPGGDAPQSLTLAAEHSPDSGDTWETLLELDEITAQGAWLFEVEKGVLIHPHTRLNVIDISGQWVFAGGFARRF